MFGIAISSSAVALSLLKVPAFKVVRYAAVFFALGAGYIYLAVIAFSLLLFAESGYRLPRSIPRTPAYILGVLVVLIAIWTLPSSLTSRTLDELIQLLIYVFLFFQIVDNLRYPERVILLMRSGVYASVAVALVGILMAKAGLTQMPHIYLNRGSNEGSTFLLFMGVVPATALFVHYRSLKYLLFALFMVAAQYIAGSASNIAISLACCAGTGFFICRSRWVRMLIVLVMVGISASSVGLIQSLFERMQDYSYYQRMELYKYGWALWQEHPWFGWGWGSTSALAPKAPLIDHAYPHFHSTYIQFVVELGALGAAIVLFWVVGFVSLILKSIFGPEVKIKNAYTVIACASILLSGMTEALLFGGDRAVSLIVILAIIYQYHRRKPTDVSTCMKVSKIDRSRSVEL